MATRLFCNLSQAFVPIYLQDSLHMPEESVAYIPLVMYVSGFLMTTMMRALNKYIGRKVREGLVCRLTTFWHETSSLSLSRSLFLQCPFPISTTPAFMKWSDYSELIFPTVNVNF